MIRFCIQWLYTHKETSRTKDLASVWCERETKWNSRAAIFHHDFVFGPPRKINYQTNWSRLPDETKSNNVVGLLWRATSIACTPSTLHILSAEYGYKRIITYQLMWLIIVAEYTHLLLINDDTLIETRSPFSKDSHRRYSASWRSQLFVHWKHIIAILTM